MAKDKALTTEQAVFDCLNAANNSRIGAEALALQVSGIMMRIGAVGPQSADTILANAGIDRKLCGMLIDQSDAFANLLISAEQTRQVREIVGGAYTLLHSRLAVNGVLNSIHRRCIGTNQ